MDWEVDGSNRAVVGFFPPARELLVVNHGLRMEEVETIIDETKGESVMILFGPGVDMRGVLVHVAFLDE